MKSATCFITYSFIVSCERYKIIHSLCDFLGWNMTTNTSSTSTSIKYLKCEEGLSKPPVVQTGSNESNSLLLVVD